MSIGFMKVTRVSYVLALAVIFWASCAASLLYAQYLSEDQIMSIIRLACVTILVLVVCSKLASRLLITKALLVVFALVLGLALSAMYSAHLLKTMSTFEADQEEQDFILLVTDDSLDSARGMTTSCWAYSPNTGVIRISLKTEENERLYFGEVLRQKVALKPIPKDKLDYYWKKGQVAWADISVKGDSRSWVSPFAESRANFINAVNSNSNKSSSGLLLALACGYRGNLTNTQLYENFKIAGLAHMVAVSGAHLNIIVALVTVALGYAKLRKGKKIVCTLLFLLVFLVLCAVPISAVRAAFMVCLGCASYFAKRRSASQNALGICIVACIIADPAVSISVSFVLSSLSTLGIILLGSWIKTLIEKLVPLPAAFVVDALSLTISAQLATLPLCCALFSQFSLIAPVSNIVFGLLFVPLCALCVICQLAFMVIGDIAWGLFALSLNVCALAALIVEKLAEVPFACIPAQATVEFALVTGVAMLLMGLGLQRLALKNLRLLHCMLACGACAALIAFICAHFCPSVNNDEISLSALDVGQGDCLLLRDKGEAIMIDTGNRVDLLKQKLAQQRIVMLDALYITHPDDDHCGALNDLASVVEIKKIYVARPLLDCPCEKCDLLRKNLNKTKCFVEGVEIGHSVRLEHCSVQVIWPKEYEAQGGNQDSICLQILVDTELDNVWDYCTLLVGDAEAETLSRMASQKLLPKADVFKVGHHGSKKSCTEDALKVIQPKVALVSVGEGNRYGHPTESALSALKAVGAKSYRTDWQGTITCYFQTDALRVVTER